MIQLFVSDIDGCLAEPYCQMNLGHLARLAELVARGGGIGSHPVYPALSICSGRPIPYVECFTQLLGIENKVLFESGGGLFDPVTARVTWSPRLTQESRRQIGEVTRWLETECIQGTSMVVDYAKRTQAGVIGPDPEEVLAAMPKVQAFVKDSQFDLMVLPTHLSIDIVPPGITKEAGIQWLAEEVGLELEEIAYIGDSIGDLGALQLVGASFAPANAKDIVRKEVNFVTSAVSEGVLEAVKSCIERNQEALEIEELK